MISPRISPSVSQQASLYGGQIHIGPRSLLGSLETRWLPLLPNSEAADANNIRELVEVNNATNQFTTTGAPETTRQPLAPVGSGAGNRPTNNTAYNRFNETEHKEREAIAENWIEAEVKKRMFTNRRKSAPNPELVRHPPV